MTDWQESYMHWLEENLLDYQPQWICDLVNDGDGWCEERCGKMNSACLMRAFNELSKEVD